MSGVVSELLKNVEIPRMAPIRQIFNTDHIESQALHSVVFQQFSQPKFSEMIKPGMRVAITCGSRGIANISVILRTVAVYIRSRGGEPFGIPTMGSHGGATAEGQLSILESLGVTEDSLGCPILSSMETACIGHTPEGFPVLIDKHAAQADAIIVVGRVKPHTCFTGVFESGIMKMMTIGLGKQQGADVCHEAGFGQMSHLVPLFGNAILKFAPIAGALAILENSYDETCELVAMLPQEIGELEPCLLQKAKRLMPKILFDRTDVLIVDKIGKNISGDGMDPNITGTFATPYSKGGISAQNVAVLDITGASHGSAVGIGMAHATTRRLFNKMDLQMSYPNAITSTLLNTVRIPAIMDNDKEAIQICIRACNGIDKKNPRIVRIPDTLHLKDILISEAMLGEAKDNPSIEITGKPEYLPFDDQGNLW